MVTVSLTCAWRLQSTGTINNGQARHGNVEQSVKSDILLIFFHPTIFDYAFLLSTTQLCGCGPILYFPGAFCDYINMELVVFALMS